MQRVILFLSLISLNAWSGLDPRIWESGLLNNIHPQGTLPGIVVASPSKQKPPYFFHWTRDAALVMRALQKKDSERFEKLLMDYALREKAHQEVYALTGLGEPKFNVDSSSYTGPWGRPQNDGPALRSITLIQLAHKLLDQNENGFVASILYRDILPAQTVIKRDLEYVAHHWREPNFDLWEEVKADHFYTLMVQSYALSEGAKLARRLNDDYAADFYERESAKISEKLEIFFHPKQYIVAHKNQVAGLPGKTSGLDVSTVLAILHTDGKGIIGFSHPALWKTMLLLEKSFLKIYPINQKFPDHGVGYGRYPEDRYYGGNPWVLTTAAIAEFLSHWRNSLEGQSFLNLSDAMKEFLEFDFFAKRLNLNSKLGVAFLKKVDDKIEKQFKRVKLHQYGNGSLSEQFHRVSGHMLSAEDLTWSYASMLTAWQAYKGFK